MNRGIRSSATATIPEFRPSDRFSSTEHVRIESLLSHPRHNSFFRFALLRFGAIAIFATVITLIRAEGDAEYFSLFSSTPKR
mgnify:FL=1